jgi:hypothetical protein
VAVRSWLVVLVFVGLSAAPARAATAVPPGTYELYVQPSWIVPPQRTGSRDELIFRRYAFSDDLTDMPNFMSFACQRDNRYDNYLTIEIPKNYEIKSFKRSAEFAKIDMRFTIDQRQTFVVATEYIAGKIYFDRTAAAAGRFDALLNGRDLIVEFGTGDVLHFHLLDNVEEFIKEPTSIRDPARPKSDRPFVDTAGMLALCHKYQQGQAPH